MGAVAEQPSASSSEAAPRAGLMPAVGPSGYFNLAVGAMVGSGWVVVVGDWLAAAGPAGAVVGFLCGTITMIGIARCYGELAARFGQAGGEFLYVLETFGRRPAFLVGWFLTLFAISVCAFEAVVLGSLFRSLFPAISTGVAYTVGRTSIDWGSLGLGLVGTIVISGLHIRGAQAAIRFQNIVTYGFIVMMLALIVMGFALGHVKNLQPVFLGRDGNPWIFGSMSIFSMCAFFLNGWQTALHALEERRLDVSFEAAMRAILRAILVAGLIYVGIILAVASAVPWSSIIHADMPVRAAFDALLPGLHLGSIVLVVAFISVAKTWSAMVWVGSRLLVAQARAGFLPAIFTRLDVEGGAPRYAICTVTVLTMLGPMAGRAAILPIVNMVSICLALSILVCLTALVRLRSIDTHESVGDVRPIRRVTIAFTCLAAAFMVGIGLLSPLLADPGQIPIEWKLLIGWGLCGWLVYFGSHRRQEEVAVRNEK